MAPKMAALPEQASRGIHDREREANRDKPVRRPRKGMATPELAREAARVLREMRDRGISTKRVADQIGANQWSLYQQARSERISVATVGAIMAYARSSEVEALCAAAGHFPIFQPEGDERASADGNVAEHFDAEPSRPNHDPAGIREGDPSGGGSEAGQEGGEVTSARAPRHLLSILNDLLAELQVLPTQLTGAIRFEAERLGKSATLAPAGDVRPAGRCEGEDLGAQTSEWTAYLEAEVARLESEVERIPELERELARVRTELQSAESRIMTDLFDVLASRVAYKGDRSPPDDGRQGAEPVSGLAAVIAEVRRTLGERLELTARALRSMRRCEFQNAQRVAAAFRLLGGPVYDHFAGVGESLEVVKARCRQEGIKYSTRISRSTEGRFPDYQVGVAGSKGDLHHHLKVGSSRNPERCFRIHFEFDDIRRLIVVHHAGRHLRSQNS